MANGSTLIGDEAAQMPPSAPVQIQPGLSTSSGQFTALFTIAAIVLAAVGYHFTPAQIETWAQTANSFVTTILPLLTVVPVLLGYITSRGKITSNAIMAQAHIATGVPVNATTVESSMAPLMSASALKLSPEKVFEAVPGVIGAVGAATAPGGFKDPNTYGQILSVAKDLGVPGAAQADIINQQLHPAQLIAGIISMFHHKTKTPAQAPPAQ